MSFNRKRSFGGAPAAATASKGKKRWEDVPASRLGSAKISTDVYPDPEPDVPVKPAGRVLMNAYGQLVDEKGNLIEPGKTPVVETTTPEQPAHFDPKLAQKLNIGRRKAALIFNEKPGMYTAQAEKLRAIEQARIEFKRKNEETREAMKHARTSTPVPTEKRYIEMMPVPEVEWWDALLLANKSYDDVKDATSPDLSSWQINISKITNLIEHPVPEFGPNTPKDLPPAELKHTKKERKKIRKARRTAIEMDKQEQYAQGLTKPPAPRVRLRNMMTVLGKEMVQDPTLVSRMVREEGARREQRHEERNQERKLSPESRRRKKVEKMQSRAEEDPVTSVFTIRDLTSTRAMWKINKNAADLHLTGFLVLVENNPSTVVIQGGRKPTRFFTRLLLHRIDYEVTNNTSPNARLLWQGNSGARALPEFKQVMFTDMPLARKYLTDMDCGHYWDLAENAEALDDAADDIL
eukprot:TRINITY_DN7661_c1_g1_i1.p1 TRINITY_DN7661_c1_g1~~TRINITY_DN7661_c1_g1_i1.p1  ORF type:complete len:464 (+),score=92.69 TRINITY_DN7661_c1_g1_i1:61-1452(+)